MIASFATEILTIIFILKGHKIYNYLKTKFYTVGLLPEFSEDLPL
jgi:hypothetical protein